MKLYSAYLLSSDTKSDDREWLWVAIWGYVDCSKAVIAQIVLQTASLFVLYEAIGVAENVKDIKRPEVEMWQFCTRTVKNARSQLLNVRGNKIHDGNFKVVASCDTACQKNLFSSVALFGGSKCVKIRFRPGYAPNPAGGAYDTPSVSPTSRPLSIPLPSTP